jgi:hypothetical protein
MYGSLMGLQRNAEKGEKRAAWVDHLDGALMAIGVAPRALAGYMYYTADAAKPQVKKGLVGYESATTDAVPRSQTESHQRIGTTGKIRKRSK